MVYTTITIDAASLLKWERVINSATSNSDRADCQMILARASWRLKRKTTTRQEREEDASAYEMYGDGEDQISTDSAMYRD